MAWLRQLKINDHRHLPNVYFFLVYWSGNLMKIRKYKSCTIGAVISKIDKDHFQAHMLAKQIVAS